MMRVVIFLLVLLSFNLSFAQSSSSVVTWEFEVINSSKFENKPDIFLKAKIKEGWHLYSQFITGDGPIPTTFTFTENPNFSLNGKVQEYNTKTAYDPNFDMEISYFEGETYFIQPVILNTKDKMTITGTIEFMVCNDHMCYPPETVPFTIELP